MELCYRLQAGVECGQNVQLEAQRHDGRMVFISVSEEHKLWKE